MHDSFERPQQYSQRLCRAAGLAALGVGLHLVLPARGTPALPVMTPLKIVHAEFRLPDRTLAIERTFVFARPAAELERRFMPMSLESLAVGTTGVMDAIAPILQGLRATAVALPPMPTPILGYGVIFGDGAAVQPNGVEIRFPTAGPVDDEAKPAIPDGSLESRIEPVAPLSATPAPIGVDRLQLLPAADRSTAFVGPRTPVDLDNDSNRTSEPDRAADPDRTPGAEVRRDLDLKEEALVRRLLAEYTGAFERLDVGAIKAVWPSVDGKTLERAYGQLASQRLTLQSCGITISGSTANARCRGSATYQPRIGRRSVEIASREWTFDLSKKDTAWRIVNTYVR